MLINKGLKMRVVGSIKNYQQVSSEPFHCKKKYHYKGCFIRAAALEKTKTVTKQAPLGATPLQKNGCFRNRLHRSHPFVAVVKM